MRDMIMMVVVLTALSSVSGAALGFLKDWTEPKIEIQVLELVKGPAVRAMLEGSSNDPINDRFKVVDGEKEESIFVGIFDGNANTVVMETTGTGFADKFGLMVAYNVEDDSIVGLSVTTHKETPGLGGNAKDDPAFAAQFKGFNVSEGDIKVTNDGGSINALAGATITSRAVCKAASNANKKYLELKPQMVEKLKDFSN